MDEIKRGAICVDDNKRLFIVMVDEPKSIHWNSEWAGNVWVGVALLDGTYVICSKPTLVSLSFKEYVTDYAADLGARAAERVSEKVEA